MNLFIVAKAAGGLGESLADAIYSIFDQILPIAIAVAALFLILTGIKLITAETPQDAEMAKKRLFRLIIGIGIVVLARAIVPLITDIFNNISSNINATN